VPRFVDGFTQLLGVVGDPIGQVRAPTVWTALFEHNGINALCVPMHVRPDALATFFVGVRRIVGLRGLIVTIPHKPVVAGLVDDLTPRARQVGVVNSVAMRADGRTLGDTFDGFGLVAGVQAAGPTVAGRRALVVGAGGVGASIAFALAEAGAPQVRVAELSAERAEALVGRLRGAGYAAEMGPPDPAGFDMVVNATPMGMRQGDPLPFDCARLAPSAVVVDVVVSPAPTPLLLAARQRGCFAQGGSVMTDHMIAAMAEFFGFGEGDWSAAAIASVTGS
jgi:shikimate dehydrogenase